MVHGDFDAAAPGPGAALNGALAFPSDNVWNRDLCDDPVDPNSDALIASIGNATVLHTDFGAGEYAGGPIGIPYVVVAGSQARVTIHGTNYGDEKRPRAIPAAARRACRRWIGCRRRPPRARHRPRQQPPA